jgi:hypothetical protein
MRIVKTIIGWVDMDHVLMITPAKLINMRGSGGFFVDFEITFAFRNDPIIYRRPLIPHEEYDFRDGENWLISTTGTKVISYEINRLHSQDILAVVNLQREVDHFIEQWKGVEL